MIAAYMMSSSINNSGTHWTSFGFEALKTDGSPYMYNDIGLSEKQSDAIRCQFNTYNMYDTIQDLRVDVRSKDHTSNATASINVSILSTPDNLHGNLNLLDMMLIISKLIVFILEMYIFHQGQM